MIEVGILYSDKTEVWKPLAAVKDFRRDGVIFFAITSERGNRKALCARRWNRQNDDRFTPKGLPWWGEDKYAICVMPNGDFFTRQWAETDEFIYLRSGVDGKDTERIPSPITFPAEAVVTKFIGAYLEPPEFEKVLAIFKEMY